MTAAAQIPPLAGGAAGRPVRLGLAANWPQFTLLVVVNVFVGGMVGLERATTSLVGTREFHLSGYLAWPPTTNSSRTAPTRTAGSTPGPTAPAGNCCGRFSASSAGTATAHEATG